MKIRILSILASIGLTLILGASPVFAGDASGSISTGVDTGIGGVVKTIPVAAPPAGTYTTTQTITLSAPGSSAIYYTTDVTSSPSTSWNKYSTPFSTTGSFDFRAVAYYTNDTFGPVGSFHYVLSVPVSTGGGGGGGGGISAPSFTPVSSPSPGVTYFGSTINASGMFTTNVAASSADNSASVAIGSGITGLTASGAPLTRIMIVKVDNPGIAAPPGANFKVGNTFYDFGPNGANFSGPVSIILPWDSNLGSGQYIAYLDNTTPPTWKSLDPPFIYNSSSYTITGQTTHFTVYTVMVPVKQVSTSPATVSPIPTTTPTAAITPAPPTSSATFATQKPYPTSSPPPTIPAAPPTAPFNILLITIIAVGCLAVLITIMLVLRRRNNTP